MNLKKAYKNKKFKILTKFNNNSNSKNKIKAINKKFNLKIKIIKVQNKKFSLKIIIIKVQNNQNKFNLFKINKKKNKNKKNL